MTDEHRHEGEVCQNCGLPYDEVYHLPDSVWRQVTPKPDCPEAGLLCIHCAEMLARKKGIYLFWTAGVGGFPDAELAALREEVELHTRLSELQHSRVIKADKAWQKAHNKPHTFPDLGELIEWLMKRAEKAEEERDRLREVIEGALRIESLWLPTIAVREEHEDEARALMAMRQSFK